MVIMVVRAATGRLNMQVVMAGGVAFIVLAPPQAYLLLYQQLPAGPGEPPSLLIGAGRTGFPPSGFSVHLSRSISVGEGARSTRQEGRRESRQTDLKQSPG